MEARKANAGEREKKASRVHGRREIGVRVKQEGRKGEGLKGQERRQQPRS